MSLRHIQSRLAPKTQGAFTIIELIVAFLIIGVLVTILTPVLSDRAEEARVHAAGQDTLLLAEAERRAAIDTGYFYRVNVLNDVSYGDGIPNAKKDPNTGDPDRVNGIRDNEITNNNLYDSPKVIFILPKTGLYASQTIQDRNFERITASLQGETDFGWNGPYINWHRDVNNNDWPDDPGGNDYYFFTKAGVIYPPDPLSGDTARQTDTSFFPDPLGPNADITNASGAVTTKRFDAQVFDRPTFLSLGPNGLPGDGTDDTNNAYGKGDDIIYQFGGN